jgi:hypothetical protein
MKNFEIVRSSDAINYNSIGKVAAMNAANNSYFFVDHSNSSVTYYRLKMFNKDGSYATSFVVTVKNKTSAAITLHPNPVKDVVTVTHPSAEEKQQFNLLTIVGKVIRSIDVSKGSTQTSIDVSFLQPGIYMLRYGHDKEKQTLKLVKN